MSDVALPELYLVSPPRFELTAFADAVSAALSGGPVACVQLWMPDASHPDIQQAAELLCPIVQGNDTAFLLNGHMMLARELGCDGVHLDAPDSRAIAAARTTLGNDAIIGVSCGATRDAGMIAAEAGADYVSFGPVYDTATKGLPAAAYALDTLSWWAEMMEVPCVAVGGITPDNLAPVVETHCEFICAVSAIWDHPDGPEAAVRAFHAAIG